MYCTSSAARVHHHTAAQVGLPQYPIARLLKPNKGEVSYRENVFASRFLPVFMMFLTPNKFSFGMEGLRIVWDSHLDITQTAPLYRPASKSNK